MNNENKVMSAEEWYYNQLSKQSGKTLSNFEIATQYANYILSQRIDELSKKKYSEEEARAFAYNAFCLGQLDNPTENKFNGWFEQFKKK